MTDIDDFDPALFAPWPAKADYAGRGEAPGDWNGGWSDGRVWREAGRLIETKSADAPREALRLLLNDMTREMRDQFDYFRKLRGAAEATSEADADDAAAKLARADVKAATDAMSLIVRTLEKIDGLQRQLARDRDLENERRAETPAYQEARSRFEQIIDARAREIGLQFFEEWKRAAEASGGLEAGATPSGRGPPFLPADATAGGGSGCEADGGNGQAGHGPPPAVDGDDRRGA